MKIHHILAAGMTAVAMAWGLTACDGDLDRPPLDIPQSSREANISILDLKQKYWQDDGNFAVEIVSPTPGDRVIIGGHVIASDSTGNIYKTIYLQDETGALAIAVDTTKLYLRFKEGEAMTMDVTGLYAGKYNGLFQIGEREVYGTGYETSQMAGSTLYDRAALNGLPDPSAIDTITTTLAQIREWGRSQADVARYSGQLVRLDGVAFEGGGTLTWSDFGTSSNRSLIDGKGNSITVRNSAYATFSQMTMPAGTGTVVAILSYYGTDWQLLMRSQVDAFGFSGDPADIPGAKPHTYTLTNELTPGKYVMVNDEGNVAIPITAGYTYGYLYVEEPLASTDTSVTARENCEVTIAGSAAEGYTIVDSYGRYLSMDDVESHRSFQLYDSREAGSVWNVANNNGNWLFTNALRSSYVIAWSAQYNNFAPSTDKSNPGLNLYRRVD